MRDRRDVPRGKASRYATEASLISLNSSIRPLGTTNYLYDGFNALEEVDQSGTLLARYAQTTSIDEPIAEFRPGAIGYYNEDGIGSVTSLSTSAGILANTYTYDYFGKLTASTGTLVNPFQYTGREFDTETGIYYYRARYFDPHSGRFTGEDPLGFGSSPNFYGYANNSPIRQTDPLGTTTTVYTLGGRSGGQDAGMGDGFQPFGHTSIEINNNNGDWVYSFDQDENGNLVLLKIPANQYFYNSGDPDNPGVFDYAPNRSVVFQQLDWQTGGKEEAALQAYLEGLMKSSKKLGRYKASSNNCASAAAKALRQANVPVFAVTPTQLHDELEMFGLSRLTGYFNRTQGGLLPF